MNHEVERKFLICTLPNLQGYQPIRYERYFLFKNKYVEIRVQKKGDRYEFERKETINNLSARKEKISITRDEFNSLIKNCTDIIIRDSFNISKTPNITLKVYG
jgi:CYTH domain-containing protein